MQRTFKKTQTSKWNVNKKEKQNIWTSEIPPGLFYVFKNRLYFSCKICLAKKKKREFSRIWSCIRLWAKKIMVLETLLVFYSNTQPEKTLSWSLPAREGFHYHNTSMSLIKEKVKCKFRPWQKVIQVNLYLRPLKVQIYDCWTKDDAGYLHSQWHLFAEYSKEKKITQVFFCSEMSGGRRNLRYRCTGLLT